WSAERRRPACRRCRPFRRARHRRRRSHSRRPCRPRPRFPPRRQYRLRRRRRPARRAPTSRRRRPPPARPLPTTTRRRLRAIAEPQAISWPRGPFVKEITQLTGAAATKPRPRGPRPEARGPFRARSEAVAAEDLARLFLVGAEGEGVEDGEDVAGVDDV